MPSSLLAIVMKGGCDTPSGGHHAGGGGGGGGTVVRSGYLKKFKTSRKKWFVLRAETPESSAKLEYYDNEKKYASGCQPKRSIPLKNCFNINRRTDLKHKNVIALYTKDDCFCVMLDSEDEVENWLKALLSLQHGEEVVDGGEMPKPTFEHVWQVTVLNRGLGTSGLTGNYRLCLTDKTLSLIKKDSEVPKVELNLPNIRSCGNLRDFFFLEIGRSSTLGAGELWMQTEDTHIAQNVHSTVFHAMTTSTQKDGGDLGPKSRNRSSSATESSKPIIRKQTHGVSIIGAPPKCILSQDNVTELHPPPSTSSSSQSQTQHSIVSGVASLYQHLIQRGSKASERRHSISAGGVTTSGQISHQRTQSLPLANPAPLSDQNTCSSSSQYPLRANNKRSSNQSSKCMAGGRERCDSMPSRPRTTSEGSHAWQQPTAMRSTIYNTTTFRPTSFHARDISHSPPTPASPPSVGCSTDSGSSYSLADEPDGCLTDLDATLARYSHSLTPDEAIAEEDCPDSPSGMAAYHGFAHYVPMQAAPSSDDGYVAMSPQGHARHLLHSPTASLSSVTSGTPSTDMRFAEYPLEKVSSYFPPTSEDGEDATRPARAYSVGSRPDSKYEFAGGSCSENLRVRALSVGSKTKKLPNRVLPPHQQASHNKKSSSAPILSTRLLGSSHNSIGAMDDLMEMDFSRSSSVNSSGYMEMKPGSKASSGYVEMKPGVVTIETRIEPNPYVDMMAGSSPAKSHFLNDANKENQAKNEPNRQKLLNNNNNNNINNTDYLDMSLKAANKSPSKTSYLQGSPSSSSGSFIDMHFISSSPKQAELATPEGYVEMSVGKGHTRQSSYDESRKKGKGDKLRSEPIAIHPPPSAAARTTKPNTSPLISVVAGGPSATSTVSSRGKYTGGMHLPLNSDSSLSSHKQHKLRKNTSRDSSSSSINTPSSSSTIFPMSLNSPASPASVSTSPRQPPIKTDFHPADYTLMDFDCGKSAKNEHNQNQTDYVNYSPIGGGGSDYAIMSPGRVPESSFRPINEDEPGGGGAESPYEVLRTVGAAAAASSRPNSVVVVVGSRPGSTSSRPSSTSSELCSSSGSTIVGSSRPESVNSDRVRPGSSVDMQLHYASLNLEEGGSRSPRTVRSGSGGSGEATGAVDTTLTYAKIDFMRS